MSHAVQGHPRQTGHSEEFWQNMVHWRKKWQPTPVFLPGEPHEQYEKAKRYEALDEKHKSEGVQHATGEERKAILIAPVRMKQLRQSGNNTQL